MDSEVPNLGQVLATTMTRPAMAMTSRPSSGGYDEFMNVPGLLLAAVAPLHRVKARGWQLDPHDIGEWWLHPDTAALRTEVMAIAERGDEGLDSVPMLAQARSAMPGDQQRDLRERLRQWSLAKCPDCIGFPLFGILVRRMRSGILCTAGHHPIHQMFNDMSPFIYCRPTPISDLQDLHHTVVRAAEPAHRSVTRDRQSDVASLWQG